MNFRKLVEDNSKLKDIDYKEVAISKVVKKYGYQIDNEESFDYDYSDFKGYLNLPLVTCKNIIELKPFMCPICKGRGGVTAGFYLDEEDILNQCETPENCRSCDGSGIVWNINSKK